MQCLRELVILGPFKGLQNCWNLIITQFINKQVHTLSVVFSMLMSWPPHFRMRSVAYITVTR